MRYRQLAFVCLCASLGLLANAPMTWGEAGELFPNVKPYDEEVPSPVTKPQKALEKPLPAQTPPPPPPVVHPAAPKTVASEFVTPSISWAPCQGPLLAPMLSPASQKRFDEHFAPLIETYLKSKSLSATQAADVLWSEAESDRVAPDLKVVVWLHALGLALRGTSSLDDRAAKAQAVLPLLRDDTLAVAQARVDAVTGLAFGALSKASDSLLSMALESECKLARMQVQCGFVPEAQTNRNLATDILGYIKEKSDAQKAMLAETSAWVDRAASAQSSTPGWQKILQFHPENTAVNTQLAELSIALFGDLAKAAPYAAKSDQPALKRLATLINEDVASAKDLTLTTPQSLVLAGALLNVADNAKSDPFDRYAIAALVDNKMAALAAQPRLSPAIAQQAGALQTRAAGIITKSGFKQPVFSVLAALENPDDAKAVGALTPKTKLQLFVKDNGAVVKYVKPTATENAEALKLIRDFAKGIGDKSAIHFVEVETDHCLVLTNWPDDQHAFLKKNVEGAYLAVAKAFDYPTNENVFPGKLPVFMLASRKQYLAVTKAIFGQSSFGSTGMFNTTDTGVGFLISYQPQATPGEPNPLVNWGRTLTWNMGFAFEARYRTNKSFPRWIEDGLSCRIALAQFPDPQARYSIRSFHDLKESIAPLLSTQRTTYTDQVVMSSIVEMLMAGNKKQFIELLNKIKDGADPDEALKETFHCTPQVLNKAWHDWIANAPQYAE